MTFRYLSFLLKLMKKIKMDKVRIIFDPEKWDSKTLQHVNDHNPPAALWNRALPTLTKRNLKADSPFDFWWTPLDQYDPTLKGWKLDGKGERVSGVLIPGEKVHKTTFSGVNSKKIGSEFELPEPQTYDPEKFADIRSDKMVGCETEDGLLNIHSEDAMCEVCGVIDHDHACPLCGNSPIYRESTLRGESVAPHKYLLPCLQPRIRHTSGKEHGKIFTAGIDINVVLISYDNQRICPRRLERLHYGCR